MTNTSSAHPRPTGSPSVGKPPAGSPRAELGAHGEDVAADYLQAQGYRILTRNWRCRHGEIDIIAATQSTVVFVEVKTRAGTRFGTPGEAVTPAKLGRVRRLASSWLAGQDRGWDQVRFDVVAVLAPPGGPVTLEHLEGVW
ncbi:YraN family protein [Rhodococcus sp. D2-41]|uniref:UPF0102 protein NVS88_05320 n=1 Tax=Speluncibacter jeojiensis TaxID=2710754 RepID=A0A9X4LYJ8_9ACTN|nr:YraN family protein [Rhodococcus sp. D2-41]MDG3011001.1 YraN family protein [Rhodococcus sp. D2-41]MDG3013976.1 YraN family protein [Corynebacteriales bacterium D3-21]